MPATRITPTETFFLFIGSGVSVGNTQKLKVAGTAYVHKLLESGPKNWDLIAELLENPLLKGVAIKLTNNTYNSIVHEIYEDQSKRIIAALAKVPHVAVVHEAVLAGENEPESLGSPWRINDHDLTEEDPDYYMIRDAFFGEASEETRNRVNELLRLNRINIVPYQTNAELTMLVSSFIDDNENNLLFRVYVPSGRLYAAEAEKLLSLFRDWLNQTGRKAVRQDGYGTASGQVYEFFGTGPLAPGQLSLQFSDFAAFLSMCADNADGAIEQLIASGVEPMKAPGIVARYGRDVRRLHLDLKHERETRMLSIQQSFESELLEERLTAELSQVRADLTGALENLVPAVSTLAPVLPGVTLDRVGTINFTVNQQIIDRIERSVIQNVNGTAHLGPEAHELLDLVAKYADEYRPSLESDVHELEDSQARRSDRLSAKQRIKGFLFSLSGKLEDTALAILQSYIESKLHSS